MEAEERTDSEISHTDSKNTIPTVQSQSPAPDLPQPESPSQNTLFHTISTYPFATDSEYQSGLSSILGHPSTPATISELEEKKDLVLRTQCFYISRKLKTPKVNIQAYKAWLASKATTPTLSDASRGTSTPESQPTAVASNAKPADTTSHTPTAPPTYPTSFAEIVDLITNNKPIPGIEEIPTTILELGSSKQDHAVRRRKPWEKDTSTATSIPIPTAEIATDTPVSEDVDGSAASVLHDTPGDAELDGSQTDIRGRPLAFSDDSSDTTRTDIVSPPSHADEPNLNPDSGSTTSMTTDFIPLPTMASTSHNKGRRKDVQGVVKLLLPDAVPNSGLVAKD